MVGQHKQGRDRGSTVGWRKRVRVLQAEEHVRRPGGRRQRGAFEELKETQLVKGALAPAQSGDERPHGGGV